jgi:hypothetical protein
VPAQKIFFATFTPVSTVPEARIVQLLMIFPQILDSSERGLAGCITPPSVLGVVRTLAKSEEVFLISSMVPVASPIVSVARFFIPSTLTEANAPRVEIVFVGWKSFHGSAITSPTFCTKLLPNCPISLATSFPVSMLSLARFFRGAVAWNIEETHKEKLFSVSWTGMIGSIGSGGVGIGTVIGQKGMED